MARAVSSCNAFAIATFSSLFLFTNPLCLAAVHAVDGHQMYFGGSVVGKASTIGRGISPIHAHTPALIFTEREGGKKYEIWRRFQHRSTLSGPRSKMQQNTRILKQKCNAAISIQCPCLPSLVKLGPRTPEKALSVVTADNCTRKRAKSSITQLWIIRFRSTCVWGLNA